MQTSFKKNRHQYLWRKIGFLLLMFFSEIALACDPIATQTDDEIASLYLIWGASNDGCFSTSAQKSVIEELNTIRRDLPSLKHVKMRFAGLKPFLNLGFIGPANLSPNEMDTLRKSFPNLPIVSIQKRQLATDLFLTQLNFSTPVDTEWVRRTIEEKKLFEFEEVNEYFTFGTADQIFRLVWKNGTATYVFRDTHQSQDCASGCYGSFYYIVVSTDPASQALSAKLISEHRYLGGQKFQGLPYWGIPFVSKTFCTEAELDQSLQSQSWVERMFAFNFLHKMLKDDGSSLFFSSKCPLAQSILTEKSKWIDRLNLLLAIETDLVALTAGQKWTGSFESHRQRLESRTIHEGSPF